MREKNFSGAVQRLISTALTLSAGLVLLAAGPSIDVQAEPVSHPNNLDRILYFNSDIRDAADCAITVEGKQISFGARVTNPSITCPDAFAWSLFARAIDQEFWRNWATDSQTWPAKPYPLCGAKNDKGTGCCMPGNDKNPGYEDKTNPSQHCPFFPGDFDGANATIIPHQANPQAAAQITAFHGSMPVPGEEGRVIRQEMAEIVFRNQPFLDYVFANNLYNAAGLGEVFKVAAKAQADSSPYRRGNVEAGLVRIAFPANSVMLKTNWLNQERARELGIVNDADNPYITMEIDSPVIDNNGSNLEAGTHYLVGMHLSSKDLPNWVWATFEHVDNPGRCDFIGCNDSFGYASPDGQAEDLSNNYTAPAMKDDGLVASSTVFAPGGIYTSGPQSAALGAIFKAFGIGANPQGELLPSPSDKGWLSYRLKGTQVDFTDAVGWPTRLGNSVTEGGFVGSSSCISCHARASVDSDGGPAIGVFPPELSEVGYKQSNKGVPDPYWYYNSDFHFTMKALPSDFVWGFLGAAPLADPASK